MKISELNFNCSHRLKKAEARITSIRTATFCLKQVLSGSGVGVCVLVVCHTITLETKRAQQTRTTLVVFFKRRS